MYLNNDRSSPAIIFSIVFVAAIAMLHITKSPLALPGTALLACFLFFITFVHTETALMILICSMLLSPEINVGGVPGREVAIRADDLLICVVFFSWIAKMAVHKELGLLRHNPLTRPIAAYVFIALLATLLGSMQGYVNIKSGFFYVLKYIEYFLLFFMVVNNLKDIDQAKRYVSLFLLVCVAVCAYAWYLKMAGYQRVAAPFDISSNGGEANTLGGYLLLMMGVVLGLFVYSRSWARSLSCLALLGIMIPPFLFTLSRGSWLGFFPMYITVMVLTKKARLLLLSGMVLIIAILPAVIPKAVKDRVDVTFSTGTTYSVMGKEITLAESGSARVETWTSVIAKWAERPFLGYGVTGAGFIDAQFPRVLGETGIMGFLIYIWMMAALFYKGRQSMNSVDDDWAKGLSVGFLAGFTGLLVHSVSASTFIIVRIMEPFWFLAAIVVMFPQISSSRKDVAEEGWVPELELVNRRA